MDPDSKGILISDKIAMRGYRERYRFNSLGERRVRSGVAGTVAYCADETIRRVIGFRDKRLSRPYTGILFLNPTWTGIPILSEPIGTYDLEDLKREVRRCLVPAYQTTDVRRGIKDSIYSAQNFDELIDVVMRW
jgi:hypothetical protein